MLPDFRSLAIERDAATRTKTVESNTRNDFLAMTSSCFLFDLTDALLKKLIQAIIYKYASTILLNPCEARH